MPTTATTSSFSALLLSIFGEVATVANGRVGVTLAKEVTPTQFAGLAKLAAEIGENPRISRSGAGVRVSF